ncbi:MAG: hypothetical protein E6I09_03985 [Chloroflexi bacterium]|nr:MAG: hypothetical protein E6I09_03985 [Chloroflexota bacterium]
MSEKATYFNEREHQICLVARMIEDARTYWVAGGGSPMAAILLAKKLYTPNAVYVTEDGVVNPEPMLPLDPIMTMVSARSSYRALQWGTMNSVGFQAQIGLMDYGILNTLQVDPYGNINSTALGDYEGEHRRFGGPGGADSIAANCWKTVASGHAVGAVRLRRPASAPHRRLAFCDGRSGTERDVVQAEDGIADRDTRDADRR